METSEPLWLVIGIIGVVAFVSFFVLRFVANRLRRYLKEALFSRTEMRIRSPLPLSDVEHRLRAAIPRWMLSTIFVQSVVGQSGNGRLNVSLYRPLLRTPFSPRLVATVTTLDGQTWIVGHFGIDKYARWFMAIWFALLGFIGLLAVPTGLLLAALGDGSGLILVAAPLAMLAFGVGFIKVGQWMTRHDRERIAGHIAAAAGGVVA